MDLRVLTDMDGGRGRVKRQGGFLDFEGKGVVEGLEEGA